MNPPIHQVGCDVSRYQGTIDWNALYNNTAFVLIKATGADAGYYVDSQFRRNQSEARRVGMPRGYYHFAGATNADQEADLFQNNIGTPQIGEWIILDWEVEYSDPVGWCLNWSQRVSQDNGSLPGGILYIDVDRLRRYNWKPVFDWGVKLWVANPSNLPVPYDYIMQQYGFKTFPGISGNVDADFYHLDMPTFSQFGWHPPVTPPTPPTTTTSTTTTTTTTTTTSTTTTTTTTTLPPKPPKLSLWQKILIWLHLA